MTMGAHTRQERLRGRLTALDAEGGALVVAAVACVVGAVLSLPFFWGRTLPIAGPGSVSQLTAIVAGVVAVAAYLVGRLFHRRGLTPFGDRQGTDPRPVARIDTFDTLVIAVAHGVIALLGCTVLGSVLADGFTDATVYFLSATALAAVAVAITAYVTFLSATGMNLMRLSTVLAAFAVIGLLAAMLSAPDPHWWQLHLSALGMTNSVSSLTFNITLIVAGLMMTAIARYATDVRGIDDPEHRAASVRLRVCLILVGVLLACVGIFPLDVSRILHNVSAVGMLITFALVVFWVRKALPAAPTAFFVFGYVSFAVIVIMVVFFAIGYYVLTATELVAGGIIFGWLVVYLRVTGAERRE